MASSQEKLLFDSTTKQVSGKCKVLFPALDFLSDSRIRTLCHVNPDNTFLFPSGMNSLRHSSGQENLRTFLKGALIGTETISSMQVSIKKIFHNGIVLTGICWIDVHQGSKPHWGWLVGLFLSNTEQSVIFILFFHE